MAGGSPLCLAGRWLVDWFWQRDWQNVWLIVGGWAAWYFYCKIETKNWLTCLDQLTDCMAGVSPPCLAGRWLVNWYWQRDWQNVGWLLVVGLLGVFEFKIETKMTWVVLTDCMAGGSPPCLAGRWLVNWYWQRDWQNVGWLLVGGWLGALWRQNPDSNDWHVLTDCMAGGSPLCLAGRWLVDWFWQRDWQNVWLIVGGWVAWYFLLQNWD